MRHGGVVYTLLCGKGDSLTIGKLAALTVAVAKGAQHKGAVHLRIAQAVGAKLRLGNPVGQLVGVKPRNMGLRPLGNIREGVGRLARFQFSLCRLFGTQQPHQHDRRFRTGRRTVELKSGIGPLEEADIFEFLGNSVKVGSAGIQRQRHDTQNRQSQGLAELFHLYHPFFQSGRQGTFASPLAAP